MKKLYILSILLLSMHVSGFAQKIDLDAQLSFTGRTYLSLLLLDLESELNFTHDTETYGLIDLKLEYNMVYAYIKVPKKYDKKKHNQLKETIKKRLESLLLEFKYTPYTIKTVSPE